MRRVLHPLGALLCLGVAGYALVAYTALPIGAALHPGLRASFAAHAAAVVYLHAFGAALALALGPLQFWSRLRLRRPRWHRWLGSVYLGAGVGVGGASGLVLALGAFGGAWSRAGFGTLALLWMATGALALACIARGDVRGHRRWMARNFALTLAAVTLRLMLPVSIMGGLDLALAYPVVAWLCWVPNLAIAQWRLAGADVASAPAQIARRIGCGSLRPAVGAH